MVVVGMAADNEVNDRLLGIPSVDVLDHLPSGILVAASTMPICHACPSHQWIRIASPFDAPSPTRKNSISYGTMPPIIETDPIWDY